MPTNEAGLSGGHDQGHGGNTPGSDMPGGEQSMGVSDKPAPSGQAQPKPEADAAPSGDPEAGTGPGD
jgi:hypothetical protein